VILEKILARKMGESTPLGEKSEKEGLKLIDAASSV